MVASDAAEIAGVGRFVAEAAGADGLRTRLARIACDSPREEGFKRASPTGRQHAGVVQFCRRRSLRTETAGTDEVDRPVARRGQRRLSGQGAALCRRRPSRQGGRRRHALPAPAATRAIQNASVRKGDGGAERARCFVGRSCWLKFRAAVDATHHPVIRQKSVRSFLLDPRNAGNSFQAKCRSRSVASFGRKSRLRTSRARSV